MKKGDVLDGKYELDAPLGRGAMGVVFVATHIVLGQRVAIKFVAPDKSVGAGEVARFLREARAVASLESEHVVRVLDFGMLGERPYMVMQLLEGEDMASELARRGALPVEGAVDRTIEACAGLADAHDKGIVHRDLKPQNLFLSKKGQKVTVKILDFGISKVTEEAHPEGSLTSTGAVLGSPLYMSPEQVRQSKSVDARTDIWSMGVVLYSLLTGRLPFNGAGASALFASIVADPHAPLRSHDASLPEALARVVDRCLEKEPSFRMPTAFALAEALVPFASPAGRRAFEALELSRRPSSPHAAAISAETRGSTLADSANAGALSRTDLPSLSQPEKKRRAPPVLVFSIAGLLGAGALAGALLVLREASREPSREVSREATAKPEVSAPRASVVAESPPVPSVQPASSMAATATAATSSPLPAPSVSTKPKATAPNRAPAAIHPKAKPGALDNTVFDGHE